MKTDYRLFFIVTLSIVAVSCFGQRKPDDNQNFSEQDISLEAKRKGKHIFLSGILPTGVHEVELRISSDRNNKISDIKEVSPHNPMQHTQIRTGYQSPGNIYYPVVDIMVERGMEGMASFNNCNKDSCIINGPFFKLKQAIQPWMIIPSNILQSWENSVFIDSDSCYLSTFYIKKRYPLVTRQFDVMIELLSEQWGGTISLNDVKNGVELFRSKILYGDYTAPHFTDGEGLGRDRLLKALEGCVGFTQRSQVKDPGNPSDGGLFLFYDLDARLFRSNHWVWGWGPSVSMLLKASEVLTEQRSNLTKSARKIGEASLRFLWKDPESPLYDIMISRWDRNLRFKDGYSGAITVADALFMAGWAWIPLYESTGDKRYLNATDWHCKVADQLLNKWRIIPHSYYFDDQQWSDWVIDETGFGMEAFAEIFRVTEGIVYQDEGRKFIERHREIFERPDGKWNRGYQFSDSSVTPSSHMVRGMGWGMEGLLAANRLLPEEGYLEYAKKMAVFFVKSQHPDGSWSWQYDKPVEQVGIGEKGTALWSYLLYRLYDATKEKVYLEAGRKALKWCMNVQYDGNDSEAYGSVVGCNPQSGVGYRSWFSVSCTYTSAFMGLAILEELALK